MSTKLTNAELSREVSLACGLKPAKCTVMPNTCDTVHWWEDAEGHSYLVSALRFAESLDACFGDVGPVALAKAKGWGVFTGSGKDEWDYAEVLDRGGNLLGYAKECRTAPARAVCLAFLAAVKAQS